MATYSTIKKGSTGSSVTELQQLLNANGYNLATDGIYGSKTAAAVRDYQAKNGLSVDGITGTQTWTSLYGGGNTGSDTSSSFGFSVGSPSSATSSSLAAAESGKPVWSPSDKLNALEQQVTDIENSKPGAYESKYQEQIDSLLDQILNREKFSYNFDADPLYQQYKDRYTQQGKMAMQDAMGQAAALSGGYGNSYAQTVGQQTYQGYLQGLNDVIPELRNQAYQMYQDEGDRMNTNLGILQGLDESDYGRYRDTINDYYTELNYFYNKFADMTDFEYNKYATDLSAWQADRAYWYQKYYDEQQQANWQAEFDMAASQLQGMGGSGSSGGGSSRGSSSGSKSKTTTTTPVVTKPSAKSSAYTTINQPISNSLLSSNQIKVLLNQLK